MCTVFDTPVPKLMHLADKKLTTPAIIDEEWYFTVRSIRRVFDFRAMCYFCDSRMSKI